MESGRRAHGSIVFAAGVAAAALLGAACSATGTVAPPTETPTAPAPPTSPPGEVIHIDWNDPEASTTFGNGWTVTHCEGEAPLLCVHDGEEWLGVIEALSSPLDDDLAAVLDAEGLAATLASHVGSYHATFEGDREGDCGPGYGYAALETTAAVLAGRPALRYGFVGTRDGVEVERNLSYVSIFDGQLQLVTVTANDPRSCVYSEELRELMPRALRELEPHLDGLAAGSELPVSTGPSA